MSRSVVSVESGTRNSVRWLLARSVTLTALLQFQRPTRNGVPMEKSVCRESKKPGRVSTAPLATLSSGAGPLWNVWALL